MNRSFVLHNHSTNTPKFNLNSSRLFSNGLNNPIKQNLLSTGILNESILINIPNARIKRN